MTAWSIIILLAIIVGSVGIFFNVRSLIRKWKANPKSWFDLLVGLVFSAIVIGVMVVVFIRYIL